MIVARPGCPVMLRHPSSLTGLMKADEAAVPLRMAEGISRMRRPQRQ